MWSFPRTQIKSCCNLGKVDTESLKYLFFYHIVDFTSNVSNVIYFWPVLDVQRFMPKKFTTLSWDKKCKCRAKSSAAVAANKYFFRETKPLTRY